jgi:hypothetical protein
MFHMLTSVDLTMNPYISTGRLILPMDNITITVQQICSTYNALRDIIVDFYEEED